MKMNTPDPFEGFEPIPPNREQRRRMEATARRTAQKATESYKEYAYREALRELQAEWNAVQAAAWLAAKANAEEEE